MTPDGSRNPNALVVMCRGLVADDRVRCAAPLAIALLAEELARFAGVSSPAPAFALQQQQEAPWPHERESEAR
ncbi:hypothetical protein ACRAVF_34045 (plasmid) [Bradyrhizobium oligotrophicum S58]